MTTGNRPILITGCQRSGTTLLHLVLDSHPQIVGVDEGVFEPERLGDYLGDPRYGPHVSLKLPQRAADLGFVVPLSGVRVLWCLRDPRDVVASMLRLELPLDRFVRLTWVDHPGGAEHEIRACLPCLTETARGELRPHLERCTQILRKRAATRTHAERVALGALCWRLKNELVPLYGEAGIPLRVVRYESLIADPRAEIAGLLDFLEIPWHADVLRHHRLHAGILSGGTQAARPIDNESAGRWRSELDAEEQASVRELCAAAARQWGYVL